VVEVIAQPIRPSKVPLIYPCISYFNSEDYAPNCFRKVKVQNIFQIKPTTIVVKNPKPNNVPVNVVVIVTTHSQVPK
jgi:hypothetical protein